MARPNAGDPFNPYRMFNGILIPEGLARSATVTAGAKLAWGRLARYAGDDGQCYPTAKTLGAEIGVGERQAQKYLAELENKKLIRRNKRFKGRAQTSNAVVFLWHDIFETGVKDRSGAGVNDDSPRGVNDRSPKESQMEESHSEERSDLDCLPMNRKNRDSTSGVVVASACTQYPRVREGLARYMHIPGDEKEYPSDRMVVDIMEAAGTSDENEVLEALAYLYNGRGLKPSTRQGPWSFSWFKTVLQDHFEKKRAREEAANPSGYHEWQDRNEARLSRARFDGMTTAIELPDAS